jgi:O-antigen/teichoic acid export membrane protein
MTGHEKDVMKVIGFSSLINIIITLLLTPRFGIMGGAISTASSLAFAQLIMTVIVNKRLGIVSHAIGRIHTRNN